jgi:hypothetical protein
MGGSYLEVRLAGRFDGDKPCSTGTCLYRCAAAIDGVGGRVAHGGLLANVCRGAHCQVESVVLVNAQRRVDFGGKVVGRGGGVVRHCAETRL